MVDPQNFKFRRNCHGLAQDGSPGTEDDQINVKSHRDDPASHKNQIYIYHHIKLDICLKIQDIDF